MSLLALEFACLARRTSSRIAFALLLAPAVLATIVDLSGFVSVPNGDRIPFFATLLSLVCPLAAAGTAASLFAAGRRRRLEVVWARGMSAPALLFVSAVAAWLWTLCGVLLSVAIFGLLTPQTSLVTLVGAVLPLALPPLWLGLAAALAFGILIGEALAALTIVAATAASAVLFVQTPVFAYDLLGLGTYWDRSLGFGPDGRLVVARFLWSTALAVSVVFVLPFLLALRDRRVRLRRRTIAGLLVAPLLIGLTFVGFDSAARSLDTQQPWPIVTTANGLRTLALEIELDCDAGSLEAVSHVIALTVIAPLRIALNPGLRVHSVRLNGGDRQWKQDESGMLEIPDVRAGDQLDIAYGGQIAIHRDDYAPALPSIEPAAAVHLPVRAYLSHDVCFLMRGGDWYPRALGRGEGSDGSFIRDLTLHVRSSGAIVLPRNGTFDIHLLGVPTCFFAAFAHPVGDNAQLAPVPVSDRYSARLATISERLSQLHAFPSVTAVLLPLIDDIVPSGSGFCAPLSVRAVPSAVADREISEQVASVWVQAALLIDGRPGAGLSTLPSSQERYPRALSQSTPSIVYALRSTVADGFERDLADLIALRRRAQADPKLHEVLGQRGITGGPRINDAVLALHAYIDQSGDVRLGHLLGLIAQYSDGAPPTPSAIARAVADLSVEQQQALRPFILLTQ